MRLAHNMNFYIFWNSHYEVCVGELSCYIEHENKLWTLNNNKTISPYNYLDMYIGIEEREGNEAKGQPPTSILKLIVPDKATGADATAPEPIYFTNFSLPEYVKFKR